MSVDPTRIDIDFDPTVQRLKGIARHGTAPFDVPYVSEIANNLWQGGCADGLILPTNIKHVVSLYKWEAYTVTHELESTLTVTMYDSESQGYEQIDALAQWINVCRQTGPVLVHCQAGLNRSSLVAARAIYLSDDNQWPDNPDYLGSGGRIIEHLRTVRSPAVLCNPAFEQEVRSWQ